MKNLKFLALTLLFSSLALANIGRSAHQEMTDTQENLKRGQAEHARLLNEIDGHQNALSGIKGNADKADEINKHNEAIRAKTARVNSLTQQHKANLDKLRKQVGSAKGTHYVKHTNGKYGVYDHTAK